MTDHIRITDSFFKDASKLRATFESRFQDPLKTRSDRFVWDYWYVPDQYRLMRTPAQDFFSVALYKKWHLAMQEYGRTHLGCHDLSPVWLSYYVDGMEQKLHSDVPHGPWAFVHSIGQKHPRYRGGETLVLKPQVLNFWGSADPGRGQELRELADRIPSPFNRLTVFDPRYPHGVTRVEGVVDPLEARVVLHGWFTNPSPFLMGAHSVKNLPKLVDQWCDLFVTELQKKLPPGKGMTGSLAIRLSIQPSGAITQTEILSYSIRTTDGGVMPPSLLRQSSERASKEVQFAKARGSSQLTIPILLR